MSHTPTTTTEPAIYQQTQRILQDIHLIKNQRDRAHRDLERAHREILTRLARAAEFKDGDTGAHIVRIGILSACLANALGMPKKWSALINDAAPMHDIGKIGIPDSILKKEGSLTQEEWLIMCTHPLIGAEILGGATAPVLLMATDITLSHHERWDGSGYPHGLAGKAIPLAARIVAVIDFFDALSMSRCYRKSFSDEDIFLMLARGRGSHFDPEIVDKALIIGNDLIAARNAINREVQSEPNFKR